MLDVAPWHVAIQPFIGRHVLQVSGHQALIEKDSGMQS